MGPQADGDSMSEESEDDEQNSSWGNKKSVYWSGDTADLEIGQDVKDAEDEEVAAQELFQSQISRRHESDDIDLMDSGDYQEDWDDGSGADTSALQPGRFNVYFVVLNYFSIANVKLYCCVYISLQEQLWRN